MHDEHDAAPLYRPATPLSRGADWLAGTASGLVGLALLVGAGAGLGAVAFRYLILEFTRLFTGHRDYSAVGRAPWGHSGVGSWFVIVAPVVGGLLYGPLIYRFAREARGHGVPEVMLAVAERGGRIRPQVAIVKSLASAITIGAGGSVGREGPIVQIGSALGSTLGQVARLSESRLRLLVACGAAGGISATFNAPIAGTFFALEMILRDFEAESFGVVVLSSFVADLIGRAAFGAQPFLNLPAFEIHSSWEYPLYAILGVAAALVGVAFIRVLYGTEDLADRIWHGPEWLRPAAGGVVLGLVLFALPELYGVGYPPLEHAIDGHYVIGLLLLLLVGKLVATSLTIAIGGSGGVFAPSLFMGAMLGSAFGSVVSHLAPFPTASAGAYGLVGMGAVFAAAARAPITAVIIIFELTGDYRIILPLMFAVALATGISSRLSRDTIYTLKLRRRGIEVIGGRRTNLMRTIRVSEAMQPLPKGLDEDTPLLEIMHRFEQESTDGLPVVDENGVYRGIVVASELEQAIRGDALDATAADLAREVAPAHVGDTLEQALPEVLLARSGLPVVDADDQQVVGWLTQSDVLRAYHRRISGQ
ncbi:MAG TPA: chloride channel protein, partial [Gaiellaceae bacterium]|nr:chloride channel protein [Gaiellaceae bacterium]